VKQIVASAEGTRAVAAELAAGLVPGAVIALTGDLGSGKTEFVKGLVAGLGSPTQVTSPTFTLVHEYRDGRLPLFHMDFYRLKTEQELELIGFDDYLAEPGICAIEWANRFPGRVPVDALWVDILITENGKRMISW